MHCDGPSCRSRILHRLISSGWAILGALGLLAAWQQACRAERGQPADEVARALESFRLEAEAAFFQTAAEQLQSPPAGVQAIAPKLTIGSVDDQALRDALANLGRVSSSPLERALAKTAEQLAQRENALVEKWRRARAALGQARSEIALSATDKGLLQRAARVLDAQNLAILTGALGALAGLLYVYCHGNRHALRRRHAGRDRAPAMLALRAAKLSVLLAVLATAAAFALGGRSNAALMAPHWGAGPKAQGTAADPGQSVPSVPELLEERKRAQAELAEAVARLQARTASPGEPDLATLWGTLQPALLKLHVTLRVQPRVAEQLRSDLEQLRGLREQHACSVRQAAQDRWMSAWVRGLAGVVVLVAIAVPGAMMLRSYRQRQDRIWRTCPMCLKEGTLKYDRAAKVARCTYVFSESPYQACDFTFGPKYLDMVKLCFPMLGTPTSGKTHWLAMTYRQLSEGEYPGEVGFFTLQSPMAEEFKRVVRDILQQRLGTSPTNPQRMPFPMIFDFADRDPWGRSNILVNVFDFAGEVVARQTMRHPQRERALQGDGFLYFLDPLEPRETQAPALDGFLSDVRMVHDAAKGKPILAPVAVCISKIDMMVTKEYAGQDGEIVHRFYKDLARIGWDLDQPSVLRRSRLAAALCEVIWPGWNLEQKLHGIRHMFFPLTPVGLDKPGEPDLTKRVIGPLGLLAPLLWLLEMNGYRVFR